MALPRESKGLFEDSESSLNALPLVDQDSMTDNEEFKIIDDTIKAISRNIRKGDWAYLSKHPEVIKTLKTFRLDLH